MNTQSDNTHTNDCPVWEFNDPDQLCTCKADIPQFECSICGDLCDINEVDGHYDYHIQLNKELDAKYD